MKTAFLYKPIDNSPLIIFRILFGFLLACQALLSIADGWVLHNLIEPKFTFSFIGMEWLQPLPGNGMYWYFAAMAVLGFCIVGGLWYRLSMAGYMLLWAGVYFMQKSVYNNHYYLLMLLCAIMLFLPANTYAALDSKIHPEIKKTSMSAWCRYIIVLQIAIVYFYASVAKLYPDWLNGTFTSSILNKAARNYNIAFFREHWFHIFIAYAGIMFDLLIIPALLWRKSRLYAFVAAVIFHLFNSATLHIGIFPYLALALTVFFFPPGQIGKLFFPKRQTITAISAEPKSNLLLYVLVPYFIIQLLLPLRHHIIKGDVTWTEEGHRLSWRMMLRKRKGYAEFKVVDKATGKYWIYDTDSTLTPIQRKNMQTKPDMLWQMAQRIHTEYAESGKDVAVYITAKVSVNKGIPRLLIDPKIDMVATEWDYFWHNNWILLYD